MGTYEVQMKGVFTWLVCWARRASTRDFHPIAQQTGQAFVPGRLSVNMFL
jgi:hypothetical protein